jgi:hypothetical protein
MSDCRVLIERFYGDIWNRQDFDAADELLAADFHFRGSLGSETVGIPAFLAYVDPSTKQWQTIAASSKNWSPIMPPQPRACHLPASIGDR